MFDSNIIVRDLGIQVETTKEMLDAIKLWTSIFNGNAPWLNDEVVSLNVAKTICEKVSKAVTVEFKTKCNDKEIDKTYQNVVKNIRKQCEYGIGKGGLVYKPFYSAGTIKVSIIQADKFMPVKFDSTGELTAGIFLDQIISGDDVYTRVEYQELNGTTLTIKNIAYKGKKDSVILAHRINLTEIPKWVEIEENISVKNVEKLLIGYFKMPNANTIDNDSYLGTAIFHNAITTLKEIDKQFSRTLWEYEGSELALHVDDSLLEKNKKGKFILPKGKERLYKLFRFDQTNDRKWNIFSPSIRDTSLFNGLNELLRQAEQECGLAFGVISKEENVDKTATEIKSSKQDYYVTVSDIQTSLQYALDDLVYAIYVLRKLYNLPVTDNYQNSYDWDDSIVVDKEAMQRVSMLEYQSEIIDKVQYLVETRDYTEKEALDFCKRINNRKKDIDSIKQEEDPE